MTLKVFRFEVFGSVKDMFFSSAVWGSAWVKCGWVQLVSKERTELRGTLKSAEFQYLLHLFTENTKGLCLKGLLKADILSVFQIILFPQADVSSFSSGWSKKAWQEGSELTVTSASRTPLSETIHFNASAIWGSLYKEAVSDWSLFRSPGRRAGPWGWLWWCAVAWTVWSLLHWSLQAGRGLTLSPLHWHL